MEMSEAEQALLNILRGETVPTFSVTITRTTDLVVVTAASPEENGILIGAGPSLDGAIFSLVGQELPADPEGGEATPRPALALVAGTTLAAKT